MHFKRSLIGRHIYASMTKVSSTGLSSKGNSFERNPSFEFYPSTVSQNFSQNIRDIILICTENNIECVFMTQPFLYKGSMPENELKTIWMTPFGENYTVTLGSIIHIANLYNQFILKQALTSDIYGIDIGKKLPKTLKYFYDDCHFTNPANEYIAENLSSFILKNGFVD